MEEKRGLGIQNAGRVASIQLSEKTNKRRAIQPGNLLVITTGFLDQVICCGGLSRPAQNLLTNPLRPNYF
jgi:hypothetical protein